MKKRRMRIRVVRAFVCSGATTERTRSMRVGFAGGAINATEKSAEHDGEEGVTIIAGNGDFSSGGWKSGGGGTRT